MALQLSGACSYKAFLNGMLFLHQGATASGFPFYGSQDGKYFMYFDRDCDGAAGAAKDKGVARWIIDTDAPNRTRHTDLDGDQHCNYLARTNTEDGRMPPTSAQWEMGCGGGKWLSQTITLESVRRPTSPPGQKMVVTGSAFELSGACGLQSKTNSAFLRQGETKSGAPYYRSADGLYYVYFDPDCSGKGQLTNMWILDLNAPNPALDADLDKDKACLYSARTSGTTDGPPMVSTWVMYCDDGWKRVPLSLSEISASNVTVRGSTSALISGQPMMAPGALPFLASVLLWAALAPASAID